MLCECASCGSLLFERLQRKKQLLNIDGCGR